MIFLFLFPCRTSHFIFYNLEIAEAIARKEEWLAAQSREEQPSTLLNGQSSSFEGSCEIVHLTSTSSRAEEVEELLENKTLYKKLILTMALQRTHKCKDKEVVPTEPPSRVIREGFYWKDYPQLEDLLYDHMGEYYEWSTRQRQSKNQQAFNNALVEKVRTVAAADGNEFEPIHFNHKRLRDRIR